MENFVSHDNQIGFQFNINSYHYIILRSNGRPSKTSIDCLFEMYSFDFVHVHSIFNDDRNFSRSTLLFYIILIISFAFISLLLLLFFPLQLHVLVWR